MEQNSSLFSEEELSSSAGSAFKAATVAVMAHAGECFTTMVKIISERYGHPIEEMIAAVQGDKRWQTMMLGPILEKLTQLEEPAAEPKKKVVKKIIKKKAVVTTTAEMPKGPPE